MNLPIPAMALLISQLFFNDGFVIKSLTEYDIPIKKGARGVMVIVVGNGHDDTSSNPGRD